MAKKKPEIIGVNISQSVARAVVALEKEHTLLVRQLRVLLYRTQYRASCYTSNNSYPAKIKSAVCHQELVDTASEISRILEGVSKK